MRLTVEVFAAAAGYWHEATLLAAAMLAGLVAGVTLVRVLDVRGRAAGLAALLAAATLWAVVIQALQLSPLAVLLSLLLLAPAALPESVAARRRAAVELLAAATLEYAATAIAVGALTGATLLAHLLQGILLTATPLTIAPEPWERRERGLAVYGMLILLNASYQAGGGLSIPAATAATVLLLALGRRIGRREPQAVLLTAIAALTPTLSAALRSVLRLRREELVHRQALELLRLVERLRRIGANVDYLPPPLQALAPHQPAEQTAITPIPLARQVAETLAQQLEQPTTTPREARTQTTPPRTAAIKTGNTTGRHLRRVNVNLCGRKLGEHLLPPDATLRELSTMLGLCPNRGQIKTALIPGKGFTADICAPIKLPDNTTITYTCQ